MLLVFEFDAIMTLRHPPQEMIAIPRKEALVRAENTTWRKRL